MTPYWANSFTWSCAAKPLADASAVSAGRARDAEQGPLLGDQLRAHDGCHYTPGRVPQCPTLTSPPRRCDWRCDTSIGVAAGSPCLPAHPAGRGDGPKSENRTVCLGVDIEIPSMAAQGRRYRLLIAVDSPLDIEIDF